jgi:cell wall-associated NlpC family hydrolase
LKKKHLFVMFMLALFLACTGNAAADFKNESPLSATVRAAVLPAAEDASGQSVNVIGHAGVFDISDSGNAILRSNSGGQSAEEAFSSASAEDITVNDTGNSEDQNDNSAGNDGNASAQEFPDLTGIADGSIFQYHEAAIYAGDLADLSELMNEKISANDAILSKCTFSFAYETEDFTAAELFKNGSVRGCHDGTVFIDVSFDTGNGIITDKVKITVYDPQQVSLGSGGELELACALSPFYKDGFSVVYDHDDLTGSKDPAVIEGSKVRVTGFTGFKVYADTDSRGQVLAASVNVLSPEVKADTARAIGTGAFLPEINNLTGHYTYVLKSSDQSIIKVTDSDKFEPVNAGEVLAGMVVTAEDGETRELSFKLIATDPRVTETTVILAKEGTYDIPVKGLSEFSVLNVDKYGGNISVDGMTVTGVTKGACTLEFNVDGKEFTIKYVISDPQLTDTCILLYPHSKAKVRIKGTHELSAISYSAIGSNVTVDQNGNVSAKGSLGNSTIQVMVDHRLMEVQAAVTKKAAYDTVKRMIAIEKTRTRYSQGYRMNKGAYDCSSLVYRAYQLSNYTFGWGRNRWAPTAAAEGQWCASHHKIISWGPVYDINKLLPGDIICFSFAGYNGRYKNISHVETYVGGGYDISASSSRNRVAKIDTLCYDDDVVLIARPTK